MRFAKHAGVRWKESKTNRQDAENAKVKKLPKQESTLISVSNSILGLAILAPWRLVFERKPCVSRNSAAIIRCDYPVRRW